jgi:hypothetical protein
VKPFTSGTHLSSDLRKRASLGFDAAERLRIYCPRS